MACEICNSLVVCADGEQSTLKETLRQTPKTFTMAGTSLQVLTHGSQRAMSEDILFRWEFQNGILDLLEFPSRNWHLFPLSSVAATRQPTAFERASKPLFARIEFAAEGVEIVA